MPPWGSFHWPSSASVPCQAIEEGGTPAQSFWGHCREWGLQSGFCSPSWPRSLGNLLQAGPEKGRGPGRVCGEGPAFVPGSGRLPGGHFSPDSMYISSGREKARRVGGGAGNGWPPPPCVQPDVLTSTQACSRAMPLNSCYGVCSSKQNRV